MSLSPHGCHTHDYARYPAVARRQGFESQRGGDITAVYDRYDYWDEKQRALATWEAELHSIIDGKPSKVVPIANARRFDDDDGSNELG